MLHVDVWKAVCVCVCVHSFQYLCHEWKMIHVFTSHQGFTGGMYVGSVCLQKDVYQPYMAEPRPCMADTHLLQGYNCYIYPVTIAFYLAHIALAIVMVYVCVSGIFTQLLP